MGAESHGSLENYTDLLRFAKPKPLLESNNGIASMTRANSVTDRISSVILASCFCFLIYQINNNAFAYPLDVGTVTC